MYRGWRDHDRTVGIDDARVREASSGCPGTAIEANRGQVMRDPAGALTQLPTGRGVE